MLRNCETCQYHTYHENERFCELYNIKTFRELECVDYKKKQKVKKVKRLSKLDFLFKYH
jgi:hypothetical protein